MVGGVLGGPSHSGVLRLGGRCVAWLPMGVSSGWSGMSHWADVCALGLNSSFSQTSCDSRKCRECLGAINVASLISTIFKPD